ncbi:MAG: hypothetical protein F4X40_09050 [Chloroflexi bacterium]|nr:hypothetical protein [Chloroflexota bacterium]
MKSEDLRVRASDQLRRNVRTGFDPYYRRRFTYVMPSIGRYEWQWFWDSCFHAIALSTLDVELARSELATLMVPQRRNGFVGHMTYWGRWGPVAAALAGQSRPTEWRKRNSGMIQPPVLAQALQRVWEESGDNDYLRAMLPRIRRFYEWLNREREVDSDGLIGVISPYECGLDNSPAYDAELGLSNPNRGRLLFKNWLLDWHNVLRGRGHDFAHLRRRDRFIMIDPFMNAVYADGWDAISTMHDALDQHDLVRSADEKRQRTTEALNEHCWDEEEGRWIYLRGAARIPDFTLAIGAIFPLIIGIQDPSKVNDVIRRHLLNEKEFWTPYPVPSVAASEPTFDPEGEATIWRGPVCLNLNWLLARGLRRHGFDQVATEIEAKSIEMASRDFREFYSPLSGRGMRGTDFGWATVAVDMLGRAD